MKYIFLFFVFLSINTFACIVGPVQLNVSEPNGFNFVEKESEFYESVTEISITAPLKYKGEPF
ncbi:hypothetical protein [Teredinibacter purpureus]|nr:hypothetical protein [Teredinibacter purpureus]